MKFKMYGKVFLIIVGFGVIEACSTEKESIFDSSQKCNLQTEEIVDAFGNVISKGKSSSSECAEVNLDPCSPIYKNRMLLGEFTEDSNNSIIVCPEVRDSPVLPSDYTEDNNNEIDLSSFTIEEDYEISEDLYQKLQTETEDLEVPAYNPSNKVQQNQRKTEEEILEPTVDRINPNQQENKEILPAVIEKTEKKLPEEKEVPKKSPQQELKEPDNKKNREEDNSRAINSNIPIKMVQKNKDESMSVSPKVNNKDILQKIVLGPFFKGKSYVPYAIKVELEEHITRVREKYGKKGRYHYKFIGYYTSVRGSESKTVAANRVKEVAKYIIWKTKLDLGSYQVILKPVKDKSRAQEIELLISIHK